MASSALTASFFISPSMFSTARIDDLAIFEASFAAASADLDAIPREVLHPPLQGVQLGPECGGDGLLRTPPSRWARP